MNERNAKMKLSVDFSTFLWFISRLLDSWNQFHFEMQWWKNRIQTTSEINNIKKKNIYIILFSVEFPAYGEIKFNVKVDTFNGQLNVRLMFAVIKPFRLRQQQNLCANNSECSKKNICEQNKVFLLSRLVYHYFAICFLAFLFFNRTI